MNCNSIVAALVAGATVALAVACVDDVDDAPAAGPDAGATMDAASAGCGVSIPSAYVSPMYETNAATELALRKAFDDLLKPMKDNETALTSDAGAMVTLLTKTQLDALYAAGAPSIKSVTTPYYQAKVDAWLADYEQAVADGAYAPEDPSAQPAEKGGAFGKWIFNARGIDLRQAIEKGSYTAAFYNHAATLITAAQSAPAGVTPALVDRLIAAFGAHPTFRNNHNATENKDVNAAGYAARRDAKDSASPGVYQTARLALITAKAAIEAGSNCAADRDRAFSTFLQAWEKSQYATVVFYLSDMITKLSGSAPDYAAILHAHGETIGFISGFKTVDGARRIITDAQVDGLLQKTFAVDGAPAEAYKLKTNSVTAAGQLQQAIGDVKAIYGFSDAEIESFKTNF